MFIYDFNQGGFVALPQCLDDFRMNFDNYPAYWFLFQSRDTSHSKLPVHVIVRTANDYEQKQTTQEFQLLGNAFDDRLEWLVGLYYLKETGKHLDVVELPFNTVFDSGGTIDNESKAVFAQGTFDITSQLSLTAGVRYTDDEMAREISATASSFWRMPESSIKNDSL